MKINDFRDTPQAQLDYQKASFVLGQAGLRDSVDMSKVSKNGLMRLSNYVQESPMGGYSIIEGGLDMFDIRAIILREQVAYVLSECAKKSGHDGNNLVEIALFRSSPIVDKALSLLCISGSSWSLNHNTKNGETPEQLFLKYQSAIDD